MRKRIVGSISHGTMISDDIIDAIDTLNRVLENEELDDLISDYNNESDVGVRDEILNWEVYNLLNELAPDGYYFGCHPGDGSDIGFWPIDMLD